MREPIINIDDVAKLSRAQVDALVKSIGKMPSKSSGKLSLTREEYHALSGRYKGLFAWVGGEINRPTMTRAEFDELTPRYKAKFIREGGKLTQEEK